MHRLPLLKDALFWRCPYNILINAWASAICFYLFRGASVYPRDNIIVEGGELVDKIMASNPQQKDATITLISPRDAVGAVDPRVLYFPPRLSEAFERLRLQTTLIASRIILQVLTRLGQLFPNDVLRIVPIEVILELLGCV
jgi:hypothetical protein